MDFADRNGDGLTDLALMGLDDNYAGKTAVYLNNGDKTFTPDPTENFDDVYNGDMTWGDFDNDGDKDILISGFSIDHKITKVYENTGTGWKARPDIKIENGTGYFFGATRWVDYNADGFLDIVLTGNQPNEIWFTFRIYLNDQQGNFSLLVDPDRLDLASSSIDMGDIDNDGDTDFAFMGWRMFNGNIDDRRMMTGLYKNLALQKPFAANTKPVAPDASKFVETSFRSSVVLKWQAGTDAETPSSQLNYNVRIRNANKNILLPTSDLSTGYIKTDRPYNASGSRLWINNIPEGYVCWSVQSVDAAKTGSLFSGEKQFYQLNGPEAIKAEIVDVTHVRLHWNDNSSIETNYRIERSLDETGNFTTLQTLPANSVSLVDEYTFLTDTYYYYRIAA